MSFNCANRWPLMSARTTSSQPQGTNGTRPQTRITPNLIPITHRLHLFCQARCDAFANRRLLHLRVLAMEASVFADTTWSKGKCFSLATGTTCPLWRRLCGGPTLRSCITGSSEEQGPSAELVKRSNQSNRINAQSHSRQWTTIGGFLLEGMVTIPIGRKIKAEIKIQRYAEPMESTP